MKKYVIIIVLLWSIPAIAQMKSATLTASGLTCSMCSKSIYKSLEKVPFIQSVSADVEKSSFAVVFKEGKEVSLDAVKKAVTDAGFSVASMKVTANFNSEQVKNDAHISLGGSNFHFMNVKEQNLQGEKTMTVIDKNFLPAKDYKKYSQYTKMTCFKSGYMESCCPKGKSASNRIYHVTL